MVFEKEKRMKTDLMPDPSQVEVTDDRKKGPNTMSGLVMVIGLILSFNLRRRD
jgi:hypothetical protein